MEPPSSSSLHLSNRNSSGRRPQGTFQPQPIILVNYYGNMPHHRSGTAPPQRQQQQHQVYYLTSGGGVPSMIRLPPPPEQQQQQRHHPSVAPTVPAPLFAGRVKDRKKKRRDRAKADHLDQLIAKYSAGRPIGAKYTYNWAMWRTFGLGTCLRCTCGWFGCIFAIFCLLVILWIFGVLWICVFFNGFCEIRS